MPSINSLGELESSLLESSLPELELCARVELRVRVVELRVRVFSTPFLAKLLASASVVACEDAPAVEGEDASTGVGLVTVPECGSSRGMEEAIIWCGVIFVRQENRLIRWGPE